MFRFAAISRRIRSPVPVLFQQQVQQSQPPCRTFLSMRMHGNVGGVAVAVGGGSTTTSSRMKNSNSMSLQESQRRTLFIQTEDTPNPESIKFVPGRAVLTADDSSNNGFYAVHTDREEIARSPLAKRLFAIEGTKSVYFGADFCTVTKFAEANWSHLRTLIFSALMDHYASGEVAVTDTPMITDTTILPEDSEVVAMIKEILEARIRPAVQEDGGDIHYRGFDEATGVVSVQLAGSCVGCPSSSVTLKNGVENMLLHYIPEVTAVHSIEEEEEDKNDNDINNSPPKNTTYEQRLAAAGIPFSD